MVILPTKRIEKVGKFPLEITVLEKQLEALCNQARTVLVEDWLKDVADIFLKYRDSWKKYIPRKPRDSFTSIERFFSCAASLMSRQLRSLVMKSLYHFLNFLVQYKVN